MNINRLLWTLTTLLFGVIGGVIGWVAGGAYSHGQMATSMTTRQIMTLTIAVGSAVVMARVGSWLADRLIASLRRVHQMSAADRLLGITGLLLGLLFGTLVTFALPNTPAWMIPVKLFVMTASSAMGMALLQGMREEMLRAFPALDEQAGINGGLGESPKFMDTNIIIDGRILELCRTGFVEGPIYVPSFVLHEVQYIADSEDSMRRSRGRRGLETLSAMREIMMKTGKDEEPKPLVQILQDIPPIVRQQADSVDAKLVVLARETGGSILTNDFNLNRVAELQGVKVLNLNALALALKPVVLPGEEMTVTIVREGKEPGQGVGYLEDGTMVVVSDARSHIGETCSVTIAQVIQTVAGKMIFAEMKHDAKAHQQRGAGDDLFGNDSGRKEERPIGERHDDFGARPGGGMRRKSRT